MKKIAIMLLLVLIVFSVAFAEVCEDKASGIKFNVPEGFTKGTETAVSKSWNGPKKGEMIWSINLNVTPIPQGVAAKQMHDIHFKSDGGNKAQYASVEKVAVKGAGGGAFLIKEIKKPDSDIYRWYVKAFGKNNMYTWIFAGSNSTFKEFGPIIMETIKSMAVSK